MKDLPFLAKPCLPQNPNLHSLGYVSNMFIVTTMIEYILATKVFGVPLFSSCYKEKNITGVILFLVCSIKFLMVVSATFYLFILFV